MILINSILIIGKFLQLVDDDDDDDYEEEIGKGFANAVPPGFPYPSRPAYMKAQKNIAMILMTMLVSVIFIIWGVLAIKTYRPILKQN